jgi:hypothetical protein
MNARELIGKRFIELESLMVKLQPDRDANGELRLDAANWHEWSTNVLNLLQMAFGENSIHFKNFRDTYGNPRDHVFSLEAAKGIFRASKADYGGGYVIRLQEILASEIFADFLEMAEHLQKEGYKDAAAVIASGTLETHLRRLCTKNNIDIEVITPKGIQARKADQMNADLVKALVYSKLDQKNVTAWLDLRNKAAHGNYQQYSTEQVVLLIAGIREFIARNPG